MALFGNKKTEKAVKKAPAKAPAKTETKAVATAPIKGKKGEITFPASSPIIKPRITEKAGLLSEKGVYAFDVKKNANQATVKIAIKEAYKVTPVKVSFAPIPSKTIFARGRKGRTINGKKAYVYLKTGDKIEFI